MHFSKIVISRIFTQLWQEYIFEGLLKSEMSSSKSAWGQLLSSRSSGYLTRVVKDSFEPFREIHFTTTWKCSARISLSVLAEIPYDGLEKTLLWRLISGKIQSVGSDCGLAPLPQLFELLTKRIPAASAIISQGLERWLSSTTTTRNFSLFQTARKEQV